MEHFSRIKGGNVSFLRKQQSRLFCACFWGPDGQVGTLGYFLDSRLRGNDTLGLVRQKNGGLLHSANVFLNGIWGKHNGLHGWGGLWDPL